MTARMLASLLVLAFGCGQARLELVKMAADAGATPDAIPDVAPDAAQHPDVPTMTIEVDWGTPTGAIARRSHYGLTLVRGSNPNVIGDPGDAAYLAQMEAMRPGLVRVSHPDLVDDSTARASGWVIDPAGTAYRWDRTKIGRTLTGALPFGPKWMITILRWPVALGAHDRPLDAARHEAFASFCADLVRALNVELRLGVEYFEVLNEVDDVYAGAGAELGKLVRRAAIAMKAVDANVKVGGTGFIQGYRPEIAPFLAEAADVIDFVSYHGYGTGDADEPDADVFRTARAMGSVAQYVRDRITTATARNVELLQTQWSLSYRSDVRMYDARGAVFDALAMNAFAASELDGTTAWNDSDGWYGKLDGSFRPRPSASVLGLYNRNMFGPIVRVTGTATADIDAMAVADGTRRALSLVNQTAATLTVDVRVGTDAFPDTARVLQVSDATVVNVGSPDVRGGVLRVVLPGWSVTVVGDPTAR